MRGIHVFLSIMDAAPIYSQPVAGKGSAVCTVVKHVTHRLRRHWPTTRIVWRGDSHYDRAETMDWAENNGADYIFGLAGNAALDAWWQRPPSICARS
jgi:hypothetical protein